MNYLVNYLVWPHQQDAHQRGLGLSGLIHEEAIRLRLTLVNLALKEFMLGASTTSWSNRFHLLITRFEKKCLATFPVHRAFINFRLWPRVPFLLSSIVNSFWALTRLIPFNILYTSIKSCLFLLSSSVHNPRQLILSSYDLPLKLTINFVNLCCTFSISSGRPSIVTRCSSIAGS